MARPVIGICAALEPARWRAWSTPAHLLPREYADAVARAAGVPVLLPAVDGAAEDPDALLDLLDGLMLAGGSDLDPGLYGAEPGPETSDTCPLRDAFEIALLRRALERDMAVLCICRGLQVLNVARGGTLHQHLPDVVGHGEHRRTLGSFTDSDHEVTLAAGSLAALTAGETAHVVKSHHHQGVDRLGDGLVVTGRAVLDDLVEAAELPGRRFALGVQWHPEADELSRVIGAFVGAAGGAVSLRDRSAAAR